jgi:phosphomannomutase
MNEADEPPQNIATKAVRTSYTCPGELYSIPRSIHLARMAAFYSKCGDCEHRFETGHVTPRTSGLPPEVQHRKTRTSLLSDESVRGVYLNELDRNRALLWGEAFAASLWEPQPMIARRVATDDAQIVVESGSGQERSGSSGPVVIVGFDERPSSPDIVTGIVLGLRRMGCPVVDLGQTSQPMIGFQLQAHNASAGLFVTGAGCDPSWTGFDFLDRQAKPYSIEALAKMERDVQTGVGRQTRKIGGHHPIQELANYEASLSVHFHALRPLRIVCGSSTRLLPRILDRLFARLPCEVTHVSLPTRKRNLFDSRDVDLQRVAKSVVDGRHHLGLVVDEDGQHVAFVTDSGRLVSPKDVARLLIEIAQRENHEARFVVATSLVRDVTQWLSGRDATAIDGGETASNLVRLLIEHEAVLALSSDGRVWFRNEKLACDAVLVLANILQALSLSDAPFAEVVSRISDDL